MILPPSQPGANSQTGRASGSVSAVLPVAAPRAAASGQEPPEKDRPAIDQLQREGLMADYQETAGQSAREKGNGLHASKAINAYGAISLVEQRQSLADILGVSVYA